MPSDRDPRVTVRLSSVEAEGARRTAEALGISVGEVLRRGLKFVMSPERSVEVAAMGRELAAALGTSTAGDGGPEPFVAPPADEDSGGSDVPREEEPESRVWFRCPRCSEDRGAPSASIHSACGRRRVSQ